MLAALIKHKPKEILKIYSSKPINVNVPNTWQVQDVEIGFKTPDNLYEIVSVIPFEVPNNKRTIGSPTYLFNENDEVIQTYKVEDIPLQIPPSISDRQFFHALALQKLITKEEALAAVKTGEIPAQLKILIDQLSDENDKFNAEMLLSGSTIFERDHPLTNLFGQMLGWTSEQIDQLFIQANTL